MNTLLEILSPDFLLRNSVQVSVMVGLGCPLVGVFLVMRRLIFMGVALPQISSLGVAFALSMHVWVGHHSVLHEASEQTMAFGGSLLFTLAAVLGFAWIERRGGGGMVEGRLGTAYVVATALSLLLLSKCPQAERGWLNLFKGEIIAISNRDFWLTAGALAVSLAGLGIFRREFLLVSFDREMAITLRKRVLGWDLLLYSITGLTIAVAVLSVGPLIAFGFLVIPPLIARSLARNMRQVAVIASILGGVTALVGFWIAYRFDLPVGPTDVALLGLFYAFALGMAKLRRN